MQPIANPTGELMPSLNSDHTKGPKYESEVSVNQVENVAIPAILHTGNSLPKEGHDIFGKHSRHDIRGGLAGAFIFNASTGCIIFILRFELRHSIGEHDKKTSSEFELFFLIDQKWDDSLAVFPQ
jgi:hypothetical protein